MKVDNIIKAEQEARRFLTKAAALRDHTKTMSTKDGMSYLRFGGKHTAALRRASLDLTRSLADLRN